MIMSVFRPSRKRNGKRIRERLYWGQYRLAVHDKITRVPLKTTDKQVADARLRRLVSNAQRVAEGLVPSAPTHEAPQGLDQRVDSFIADLEARGNVPRYIGDVDRQVRTLIKECEWLSPQDISAMSFESWRARVKKSPKTSNEYLGALKNFVYWLRRHGVLAANPLEGVEKVKTAGREVRRRRAFTDDEMQRLLGVADWRAPMYLTAIFTGLRRGELEALVWGDLHLDVVPPFIAVRASTSKNRRQATLPLHRDAVAALVAVRPAGVDDGALVFRPLHRMREFKKDLAAAGIEYCDSQGRYLDFHSFRHTTNTLMARNGVGERIRMEVMRHSDARLTNRVYVDSAQLPTAAAMDSLPSIMAKNGEGYAQLHVQSVGPGSPDASQGVVPRAAVSLSKPLDSKAFSLEESRKDAEGPNAGVGSGDRARTCNILVNSQALYH
jgi:integrase